MIVKNSLPQHYSEVSYIDYITKILLENLDDSNSFYIIHPDLNVVGGPEVENLLTNDTNFKIGIHVGNERDYEPKFYEHLDIVFRFYLTKNCDYQKIYPINIGYNSTGKKDIRPNPTKKLSERKYDVLFIGNQNIRPDFTNPINKIKHLYNIHFTNGFRQGVPVEEYYTMLSESKICLVPSGYSPETFRYTESFGSGCIVITDSKDDVWYYNDTPAVVVSNWSVVTEQFLNDILSSNIDIMYEKNLKYYKECLSPEANANFILNIIKSKKII
jgi:hypothetical protein